MSTREALGAAIALAASLCAATATANGRFPAAGQVVVDPTDAAHVVVRTTYGILTTRDAGESWDWICEQAVQWTGQYDPSIAVTADSSVIAGIYDHLGVAHGDTCGWSSAAGLEQKNVVDVSTERGDPSASVALASNGLGNDVYLTQVWQSPDDATSWSQAGIDLPDDFQGLTLDVAPSNALRIYASGMYGGGAAGAIERSTDRGANWERRDVPGSDADHEPFIAAVDPADELRLYVRLSGTPGRLLVSPDGGDMWEEVFTGTGLLKGFALSPDGQTLLVGGETDGVWRAAAADLQFEKVSEVGVQCLAWSEAGVYACAGEFKDGFTIGLSRDQGASFSPVMHLPCVRGPLSCAPDTEVGSACPAAWPATADVIDQDSCAPGAGGGGSSSSSTGGADPAGGADDGGCGCRAAPRASIAGAFALALPLAAMGARRRARRRFDTRHGRRL